MRLVRIKPMKEIIWTTITDSDVNATEDLVAKVGSIRMRCWRVISRNSDIIRWRAHSGLYGRGVKSGPLRKCLCKAKEDAVRLARELLSDYQAGIDIELANFDL